MNPRFSIVMPVRNGERYLSECLDSVLAQRFGNWECLCVDDASTDGTLAILEKHSAADARIRVFANRSRMGVSASRNKALDNAKGEYIAFLDADDAISENWLARADEITKQEDPDLLRFAFLAWDEGTPRPVAREDGAVEIYHKTDVLKWGWRTLLCGGHSWLLFIRKDAVASVRFPEDLAVREDVVFAMDLLPNIAKVCVCRYKGYWYRMRRDSAWHKSRDWHDAANFPVSMLRIFREQGGDVTGRREREAYTRALLNNLQEWVMLADAKGRCHDGEIISASTGALEPVAADMAWLSIALRWRISVKGMMRWRSLLLFSAFTRWAWFHSRLRRKVKSAILPASGKIVQR